MFEILFLDLDDTILDFHKAERLAIAKTIREFGVEPTEEDLWNASRMAFALVTLMEQYDAKAAALACFNLLRTGTTACLGVSYINNSTDMCVSCEGDADSAITMLLMNTVEAAERRARG